MSKGDHETELPFLNWVYYVVNPLNLVSARAYQVDFMRWRLSVGMCTREFPRHASPASECQQIRCHTTLHPQLSLMEFPMAR